MCITEQFIIHFVVEKEKGFCFVVLVGLKKKVVVFFVNIRSVLTQVPNSTNANLVSGFLNSFLKTPMQSKILC